MKSRFLVIGCCLLLVIASCTKVPERGRNFGGSDCDEPSPVLSAIDSLMWRQPDSALAMLMDYIDDDGRDGVHTVSTNVTFDNHYVHLLLAELLYKNYQPQTNRPELRQAVEFFDSLTLTINDHPHASWRHCGLDPQSPELNDNLIFLDARAHYINGVGFYEQGDVVNACKEYMKALEVMEEHFEEKDLMESKAQFMAYTYTRLTDLFSDLYLHEQAVYYAQRSMAYYNKLNTTMWHIARMLNEIGSQYDMMKQLDSATYYYQKAINVLDDTITLVYRDIAAHLIYLEYKKGFCQAETVEQRLRYLLQSSERDRESQARHMNLGELFYHEKRYDSAWVYLNKVFQTTSIVGLKRQAAEWLVEIGKAKELETHDFTDFLAPFANQEENKSEKKSQLTELYKVFGQFQQERKHQEDMRQHRKRLITIVAGWSFVTLTIIVLFYYFSRRRKQHYETQLETERQTHKIQQAALAGRLKRSNMAMKKQLKHNTENKNVRPTQPKADKYEDEPICQQIISVCNNEKNAIKSTAAPSTYSDIALTDAQKAELKNAALAHYAPLFETLKQQHPELKEKDFMYCYLCLLGLDNIQIAVMLQHSLSTIWDREKRLKRILDSEDRIAVALNGLMIN